jgi:hypothetical protein
MKKLGTQKAVFCKKFAVSVSASWMRNWMNGETAVE